MVFRKKKNSERQENAESPAVRFFRVASCIVWFLIILLCLWNRSRFTVEGIIALSKNGGIYAALVIFALFALKSLSVVLYSGILFVASGLLFPLPAALLVSMIGSAIMVTIPYLLGRVMGKAAVEKTIRRNPKFSLLSDKLKQTGFFTVLLIRIIGLLPADLVSSYLGALRVSYPTYLTASLLGILPTAATFAVMGNSAGDFHSPAFWISVAVEIGFLIFSGLFTLHLQKKHRAARPAESAEKSRADNGESGTVAFEKRKDSDGNAGKTDGIK